MKKTISILLTVTLLLSTSVVELLAEGIITDENNIEHYEHVSDDLISQQVIENGLYEEEKVQKYDSLEEGVKAKQDIIENNSVLNGYTEEDGWFVDNCVIVGTEEEIAFDTTNVISAVQYNDIYYIQYETVQDAESAIETFELYSTVEYVESDGLAYTEFLSVPAKKLYSSQDTNGYRHYSWGISKMGLDAFAEYLGSSSNNVKVAVVSSGVDVEHPYLQGYVSDEGVNCYNEDPGVNDEYGQGTHVAGIIADCTRGLNVEILPIKVIGKVWATPWSIIADGVGRAVEMDADVICLTIWGSESSESQRYLHSSIDNALASGIPVVACAGDYLDNTAYYCPSHRSDIIITAAIDENNANYSEVITHRTYGSNYGSSVDITAPGKSVLSSSPYDKSLSEDEFGYGIASGTAVAAAHVSAAVAMLKICYPNALPAEIENMLKTCAMDFNGSGHDTTFGFGYPVLNKYITDLTFYDVMATDWYYESILEVYSRGYMTGMTENYFGPVAPMKRQDMAVLLYRMNGAPLVAFRKLYTDVGSDAYYANASVWAYDTAIMRGSDGRLGVDDNIIRQDIAVVLYRYAILLNLDVSDRANINGYRDADEVSDYAQTAVSWAVGVGIMGQGVPSLNPRQNASRADISVMINRFLQTYNL